MPRFYGVKEDFKIESFDGDSTMVGGYSTEQELAPDFLDKVREKRDWQDSQSFSQLTKGDDIEKFHLARIPRGVVNKWEREGFHLHEVLQAHQKDPIVAANIIVKKLQAEGLGDVLLTNRSFG